MRIEQKNGVPVRKEYYCNRIFGSSREIQVDGDLFKLDVPDFTYSEIAKHEVSDCANALKKANSAIEVDNPDRKWTKVELYDDDHCYQLKDEQYLEDFRRVIRNAIDPKIPPIDWYLCEAYKPGYLYVMRIDQKNSIPIRKEYYCNRIFGSSNKIRRYFFQLNFPDFIYSPIAIHEVSDCANAFEKASGAIEIADDPYAKWKKVELYKDDYCYQLTNERYLEDFRRVIRSAIDPKIPPINWLPCEASKLGYLYIMRIDQKNGIPVHKKYYCNRIFGSSEEVDPYFFQRDFPDFIYLPIVRHKVSDCANALEKTISAIEADNLDRKWRKVELYEDDHCYQLTDEQYLEDFRRVIRSVIDPRIPPIDWRPYACEAYKPGYLYLMRIDQKNGIPVRKKYYCYRIFGSRSELDPYFFELDVPDFIYSEIVRPLVTDCANALKRAIAVLEVDVPDKKWRKVQLYDDGDYCYQLTGRDEQYLEIFGETFLKAFHDYIVGEPVMLIEE